MLLRQLVAVLCLWLAVLAGGCGEGPRNDLLEKATEFARDPSRSALSVVIREQAHRLGLEKAVLAILVAEIERRCPGHDGSWATSPLQEWDPDCRRLAGLCAQLGPGSVGFLLKVFHERCGPLVGQGVERTYVAPARDRGNPAPDDPLGFGHWGEDEARLLVSPILTGSDEEWADALYAIGLVRLQAQSWLASEFSRHLLDPDASTRELGGCQSGLIRLRYEALGALIQVLESGHDRARSRALWPFEAIALQVPVNTPASRAAFSEAIPVAEAIARSDWAYGAWEMGRILLTHDPEDELGCGTIRRLLAPNVPPELVMSRMWDVVVFDLIAVPCVRVAVEELLRRKDLNALQRRMVLDALAR